MRLKKHLFKAITGAFLLACFATGGVNAHAEEQVMQSGTTDEDMKVDDFGNGYYGVTFAIPGTEKECYIAGLKADAVDDVRERFLESYESGKDFNIDQLDIIDTEKDAGTVGNDSLLCWAGAASNLLQYTGWGRVAGFANEDMIFREFAKYFEDNGNLSYKGYGWFFRGQLKPVGTDGSLKQTGGYLKGYDYESICAQYIVGKDWQTAMRDMVSKLKAGYGVNVDCDWYMNGDSDSAHALTLWGIIIDKSYSDTDKEYYDSFIVADSDNDKPYYEAADKTTMPNTLNVYHLTPFREQGNKRLYDSFMFCGCGVFTSYSTIMQYSDVIEKETDERATLNSMDTPDLKVGGICVASTDFYNGEPDKVLAGDVYIIPKLENIGAVPYAGKLPVEIRLTDSTGKCVGEWDESWTCGFDPDGMVFDRYVVAKKLQPGEYTVSVTVNPQKDVTEALFINNTKKHTFTVIECEDNISDIEITAEVSSADKNGTVTVKLFNKGLEESKILADCDSIKFDVMDENDGGTSYAIDSSDIEYDDGYDPEAGTKSLPRSFTIRNVGNRVRFVYKLVKGDITVYLRSPAYDVEKCHVHVEKTDNNTQAATEIASDANKLNEGEQFAFKIVNDNTGTDGKISGTYRVYTVQSSNGDIQHELLKPVSFELEPGHATDEIIVDSWELDYPFGGSCNVIINVTYMYRGEEYNLTDNLSYINIREKGSSTIDFEYDRVNPYDEKTTIREAIAYAEEHPGETVKISDGLENFSISEPIHISGKVKIEGFHYNYSGELKPLSLMGDKKKQMFIIDKGGELELEGVRFEDFFSDTYGGAIRVNGGKLILNNCAFDNCKSTSRGGSIYIEDGRAVIKNTSFFSGSSGFGGSICTRGKTDAELLNCCFYRVKYSDGVICNDIGKMNIINCTLADCTHDDTTTITGAIYGGSNTNVINSIVAGKLGTDISPRVKVFASVVRQVMTGAKLDALSITVDDSDVVFTRQMDGLVMNRPTDGKPQISIDTRSKAAEGYLTTVSGGVVYVSKDGKTKTSTGVKTKFTDEDLSKDIYGSERPAYFGCYVGSKKNIEDLEIDFVPTQLYTGEYIIPDITVRDGEKVLKNGVDYKLALDDNKNPGTAKAYVYALGDYVGKKTFTFEIVQADLSYRAYVQKKGWMAYKKNGALAGTTDSLRMETIQLKLGKNTNVKGGIKYRAYVQKLGWTFWADTAIAASYAGTKGRSLRIEAVQIKPYGDLAKVYDVYYRVYTDKYKWLDWAKNGASAGTSGLAYKLRGFEVKLVEKGAAAPGKTTKPYATNKKP